MSDDEFFVGYLPPAPQTRRRNRLVAVFAIVGSIAAGVLGALAVASPGRGTFLPAAEFIGLLRTRPYPMVDVIDSAADGGVSSIRLVRGGKVGFGRSLDALEGHVVTVRGGLMQRGDGRMLEVYARPRDTALPAADLARLRAVADVSLGEVTLLGEIVDGKCWLGRMKPGGGRAHRACAQLCVLGGVPPVFITRDGRGQEREHLLAARDGGSIGAHIIDYLAEPVRVSGTLYRHADLLVLRTDPSLVERR